jgi:predicted RNase H-like HicB family nuclease
MDKNLWERAKKLAARDYSYKVLEEELSDGTPIYMAQNPELPGCRAQGATPEEALANLNDARIDYIYSLLEDNLDVPVPTSMATTTGTAATKIFTATNSLSDSPDTQDSEDGVLLFSAALRRG